MSPGDLRGLAVTQTPVKNPRRVNNDNDNIFARKLWNRKVTVISIVIRMRGRVTKVLIDTGGFGNERSSGDHPHDSIVVINQNTEESPGDIGDLISLRLQGKTISKRWYKNSKDKNNNDTYLMYQVKKGEEDT